MRNTKASVYGNPFIGVYAIANDSICLVAKHMPDELVEKIQNTLGVETKKVSIGGTGLLGIYAVLNSNGIIVPSLISDVELEELKKLNLNVYVSEGKFNAIGNNLSINDKGGIINKNIPKEEADRFSEFLGINLVPIDIKGYEVVGSLCAVTNKGFVVYNDIRETQLKELEEIFKVNGINSTANTGSYFVGLCLVANSKGCVVGDLTTGFELQRIQEGLELI
ncbi:translation initiation factor IF-6 [Candidatus Micrarchaeota archaeon]|jgi:translation initiation factor 6|nr:translation initiation factor IF-6 [Candidatus Micrarchaeota archaeon]